MEYYIAVIMFTITCSIFLGLVHRGALDITNLFTMTSTAIAVQMVLMIVLGDPLVLYAAIAAVAGHLGYTTKVYSRSKLYNHTPIKRFVLNGLFAASMFVHISMYVVAAVVSVVNENASIIAILLAVSCMAYVSYTMRNGSIDNGAYITAAEKLIRGDYGDKYSPRNTKGRLNG